MAQDFVRGKKVCELPLDEKAKLLVYLDQEYDAHYFDSALYFFDGKKSISLSMIHLRSPLGKTYTQEFIVSMSIRVKISQMNFIIALRKNFLTKQVSYMNFRSV